jgi:hypothetical protein
VGVSFFPLSLFFSSGSSGTDRVKAAIRQENGLFSGSRNYGILPPVSLQETQRSRIMEKIPREFLALHGLLYTCFICPITVLRDDRERSGENILRTTRGWLHVHSARMK